jgi:sRNA-binding regulator protein Hfq
MKTQEEFLKARMGKSVKIVFPDSKQIRGTLLASDTYTLLVQQERKAGQVEVLVFKHAIKYITC